LDEQLAKQVIAAKRQVVEGSVELWNARLDLLRRAGDLKGVLEQLRTPSELADTNLGCNGNCKCAPELGETVSSPAAQSTPAARRSSK
jgi:hypothetical protein